MAKTDKVTSEQVDARAADLELLRAVKEGDATAFRGLVEKYQGRVYCMVYGMVRDREDAKDVTQEAFIKAYRNLDSFREESSFYTWLYRIAMNLSIDLQRKRKRRPETNFDEAVASRDGDGGISELHHGDSPARALERKELYGSIMDALEKLPEDQKQVLLLRELEGLSYREIGEVMDVPEGTVMSRLFYARKRMQQLLSGAAS